MRRFGRKRFVRKSRGRSFKRRGRAGRRSVRAQRIGYRW